MSLLLNTCSGMTNRVPIDDGARWILQGDEQERENRTAGVKALYSMLAATTSSRAKELVKQGLSDRNGMIAFGRIRERFGKTAGVGVGKGGMSRGSTDKCYCCGQVGHRRPDCPRRNENCSLCDKGGHLSHVCRSSGGNASAQAVEA